MRLLTKDKNYRKETNITGLEKNTFCYYDDMTENNP